jgi:hypothetical protein
VQALDHLDTVEQGVLALGLVALDGFACEPVAEREAGARRCVCTGRGSLARLQTGGGERHGFLPLTERDRELVDVFLGRGNLGLALLVVDATVLRVPHHDPDSDAALHRNNEECE